MSVRNKLHLDIISVEHFVMYLIKCHIAPVAPPLLAISTLDVLAGPPVPVLADPLRVLNFERRYVPLHFERVGCAEREGALLDLVAPVAATLPHVEDDVPRKFVVVLSRREIW